MYLSRLLMSDYFCVNPKHTRQHIPGDYKGHIPGESGLHWHVNTRGSVRVISRYVSAVILKTHRSITDIKVSHDRGLPDSIILSPPGIGVGTKPQS